MATSNISYEQLKGVDLVSKFADRSELVIRISKKQQLLLGRSWDWYGKYAATQSVAPGSVNAKIQLFRWVLFDLYCSIRHLYLPEITRLYISEAKQLLPVEFRSEQDESVSVVFRRALHKSSSAHH
jgi:hypothetical protein